jgi:DNA-binding NarL/FixJ family response regulator
MRILLADGETNVRYGLRVLLAERPGFGVVGEAAHDRHRAVAQTGTWSSNGFFVPDRRRR